MAAPLGSRVRGNDGAGGHDGLFTFTPGSSPGQALALSHRGRGDAHPSPPLWVPACAGMTGEGERRQITFCPTLELHHRRVRKLPGPALTSETRVLRHVAVLRQPVLRCGLDRGHNLRKQLPLQPVPNVRIRRVIQQIHSLLRIVVNVEQQRLARLTFPVPQFLGEGEGLGLAAGVDEDDWDFGIEVSGSNFADEG